jgi:hypothetical protein
MNPNLTTINTVAIRLRHLASAFDHTGNEFMAGVLREQSFVLDRAVMEMHEKTARNDVLEAIAMLNSTDVGFKIIPRLEDL